MNSKDQNHDEDAFKRELAGFQRTAPPDEWRDELIANAVPSSGPVRSGQGRRFAFRFSLPERILGGTFAAAWLVIVSLWIATPGDQGSGKTRASGAVEKPSPLLGAEPFPMLAWRFTGDETLEELLR